MSGKKFDGGKPDYTLLPLKSLEGVVRVLEFGLKKGYKRDSWKTVPDGRRRYLAAVIRHLAAILDGEKTDPESGLAHIYHLACDAVFLCEFERKK